ncbi:MAG: helix-turn-helix transcriptional regulator [Fibrobacteria bacterium]|nr:helix-turn-helix transcriptional regulator [Fibrobacteria bacterium]
MSWLARIRETDSRTSLLALLWILVGLGAGFLGSRQSLQIWPAPLRVIPFGDEDNGGHSVAWIDTADRILSVAFRLDSGAQYPVAGGVVFLGADSEAVDLSEGTLEMELATSRIPSFRLCLVEHLPGYTRDDQWQTARYECADRELLPGTSRYSFPIQDFLTPAWWYVASGLRLSQIGPEKRSRIVRFVLQSAEGTPIGEHYTLKIRSIRLRGTRVWALLLGILSGLVAAGLQLRFGASPRRGIASAEAHPPTTGGKGPLDRTSVAFQPVEAVSYSDRERDAVVECIAKEFIDPELSLERVARSTGVPLDRVTAHLRASSGLLFKAYLNRVRGEAARKLLLETDLPVAEIATKVGYGSVPHFNRVFRELFDTTPTALREGAASTGSDPAPVASGESSGES